MEVAHSESIVAREHPEWILYLPGSPSGLLNLAVTAAQDSLRWQGHILFVDGGCSLTKRE